MPYEIYYDWPTRVWWAFWKDDKGNQIAEAVHGPNRDECLIELGAQRGTIYRPIEVLIEEDEDLEP